MDVGADAPEVADVTDVTDVGIDEGASAGAGTGGVGVGVGVGVGEYIVLSRHLKVEMPFLKRLARR